MRKRIHLTESQLYGLVKQALDEQMRYNKRLNEASSNGLHVEFTNDPYRYIARVPTPSDLNPSELEHELSDIVIDLVANGGRVGMNENGDYCSSFVLTVQFDDGGSVDFSPLIFYPDDGNFSIVQDLFVRACSRQPKLVSWVKRFLPTISNERLKANANSILSAPLY